MIDTFQFLYDYLDSDHHSKHSKRPRHDSPYHSSRDQSRHHSGHRDRYESRHQDKYKNKYLNKHSDKHQDKHHDRHRDRHQERRSDKHQNRYQDRHSKEDNKHFIAGKDLKFETKSHKEQSKMKEGVKEDKSVIKKEEPNFSLSGKLAEDTNTFNGIVIKYNQPPEAQVPKRKWRLYPFKEEEALPHISLSKQSAFLFGRDRKVVDIPIDHPSCSKQHAVIQFRSVDYERPDGVMSKRVKPYLIDLESSNGTFLNNNQIENRRYYELFEKDVIKFGFSSREYVLLTEDFKDNDD